MTRPISFRGVEKLEARNYTEQQQINYIKITPWMRKIVNRGGTSTYRKKANMDKYNGTLKPYSLNWVQLICRNWSVSEVILSNVKTKEIDLFNFASSVT